MEPKNLSLIAQIKGNKYPVLIIGGFIAVYCMVMGLLVTFIYTNYLSTHDLAIFEQSFWSTVHNIGFFTNTVDSVYQCSFGAHDSPVLIALLPLYLVFQHPLLFPLLSTILLGVAAIPLFLIAREIFTERFSYIIVAVYLLSPAVHGINLYNFSTISFVPLLFFLCWYGLIIRRWGLYLIAGLSLIMVREDVALLAGMIGVYGLLFSGNNTGRFKTCHIVLIIAGVLFAVISLAVIIPFFSHAPSLSSQYTQNFVENFQLYANQRIILFLETFVPLLLLPFAAPEILLVGIFQFLEVFLSPQFSFLDLQYHYPGMFQPVLILATLYGMKRIYTRVQGGLWENRVCWLEYALIFCSIVGLLIVSPLTAYLSVMIDYQDQLHTEKVHYLDSVLEKIPADAVIVTQDNVIPHLAERKEIYLYGYHPNADYVILETGTGYANIFEPDIKKYADWTRLIKKNEVYVFSNPRKPNLQGYLKGL